MKHRAQRMRTHRRQTRASLPFCRAMRMMGCCPRQPSWLERWSAARIASCEELRMVKLVPWWLAQNLYTIMVWNELLMLRAQG